MSGFNSRVWAAAAVLVLVVACAREEDAEAGADASVAEIASPAAETAGADAGAAAPPSAEDAVADGAAEAPVQTQGVDAGQLVSAVNIATDPTRKFVRTAQAEFQVKDVYASTLAIEDAVAAEGGFVAKNSISTETLSEHTRPIGDGQLLKLSEVVMRGTLRVRVPSEKTQAFLRVIAKQMQFLDARTFQANDVQFDLLRRQLAFQRAQELQDNIRRAAAQPGRVDRQVDAVQAREQMLAARDEARVAERELEDEIAFSTLTLTLSQSAQVREQTVPDTEAILRAREPGFFSRIGDALQIGWRGLQTALVAIVYLWPLWVVLAAAGWLLWLLLSWRRARRGSATPSA